MKPTCRYIATVLLSASAFLANAKEGYTPSKPSLQFMQNMGQITDQHGIVRKDIDAKVEANGVVLFVEDGEMHYQWIKTPPAPLKGRDVSQGVPPLPVGDNPVSEAEIYRMDVKLVGANKNAEVIFEEPSGYYEHYYTAHTGDDGVMAKGYGRITYKNIYPNIDWVIYTSPGLSFGECQGEVGSRNIKYDFIIHPGGNPADIKLRYDGATELKLANGSLVAVTPFGTITEAMPYSYNAETGEEVESSFGLSGNILSFAVGSYSGTLVIDPTIEWATYYGGNAVNGLDVERIFGLSTDSDNNVYIVGSTASTSNIATTGAFLTVKQSRYDGYIARFNSNGSIAWGTYYGGASDDFLTGVSVDKDNRVYVCGTTISSGLATIGAYKTSVQGVDAILARFTATGARVWSTYFGGSGFEGNTATVFVDDRIRVACGDSGYVYLTGITTSTSGIAFGNTHQLTFNGTADAFLTKFDSLGNVLWGTYYGGSRRDGVGGISVSPYGHIILVGQTQSTTDIATAGCHQASTLDSNDGYIAKFSATGVLLWSSYYGGDSTDQLLCVTSDSAENIYAGGMTESHNSIATSGSSYPVKPGIGSCGYLVKFNSSGARQWGTYSGGCGWDQVRGIDVDLSDNLYLTGFTRCANGISTWGAHNMTINGVQDGYFLIFKTSGVKVWGTYIGGTSSLNDYCFALDERDGFVYIGGMTQSPNIATQGAHQTALYGNDGYLVKYKLGDTTVFFSQPFNDTALCIGDSIHIRYDVLRKFTAGNTFTFQLSNASGSFNSPVTLGSVASDSSGIFHSVIPTVASGIGYRIRMIASTPNFISENGINIKIGPRANKPVASSNSPLCTEDTLKLTATTSTNGVSWNWAGPNGFTGSLANPTKNNVQLTDSGTYIVYAEITGCKVYDTVSIIVRQSPQPVVAASNTPLCEYDTLRLTATVNSAGSTYEWIGANNFSDTNRNPVVPNISALFSGQFTVIVALNGCERRDTTDVVITPYPSNLTVSSNSPLCTIDTLRLNATTTTTGVNYSWVGPVSFSSSLPNPVLSPVSTSNSGDYILTCSNGNCSVKDTVTVVINQVPSKPTAGSTNSPLCQRQDLQLTATNITGAGYAWYGPSSFTSNVQNPVRANIQMGDAGKYYVYATVNGCVSDTDSVAIVVNTDPFVNIFPTPGASICQGKQVIFTAVPTNGGATSYNWLVNGITTGSTGITYNTTMLNNGDVVSCAMTSTGTCATPFIDTSNAITMTVQPILTPTVTMTADNMPPWNGGLTVTFTATPTHGGTAPEYQWKRNGQDITGATGATWGVIVNALNVNEDICVVLKSSYECAVPDTAMSNCITSAFTGVGDIVNNKNIKIYPNPVSGILHIDGAVAGSIIELTDVLGRKCATAQLHNSSIDVRALVPGVYVVRVNGLVVGRIVRE